MEGGSRRGDDTYSMPEAMREDLTFVCGALRSGTTLLRIMLNGHPGLSNPGEMDFLFDPPRRADGAVDMPAFAHSLGFNRVFRATGLTIDPGLNYPDLIRSFAAQLRTPGKRLSINLHRGFDHVPEVFPEARYVHLLRDPRDVAKSAIGMGWAGNVFHGIDHWIDSEREMAHLKSLVPAERVYTIRNESLIADPVGELTRLCGFLGVSFDPQMLEYPSRSTYKAPDRSLIEQWRKNQSPREVALIEGKAAAMMMERGYALSGIPVVKPGAAERLAIRLDNSARRFQHLVGRYGPTLAFLNVFRGKTPFRGFDDFVRRGMLEREKAHLK
jgi:Sulfotransferase family